MNNRPIITDFIRFDGGSWRREGKYIHIVYDNFYNGFRPQGFDYTMECERWEDPMTGKTHEKRGVQGWTENVQTSSLPTVAISEQILFRLNSVDTHAAYDPTTKTLTIVADGTYVVERREKTSEMWFRAGDTLQEVTFVWRKGP